MMLHDPPSHGSVRALTMIKTGRKENKMGRKDGEEKVGADGKTWAQTCLNGFHVANPVMYDHESGTNPCIR